MVIVDNKKMILIYGFKEEEKEFIKEIAEGNNIKFKVIEKTMANMKLIDIINGLMIEVYDKAIYDENVILFHNIDDEKLNILIPKIRSHNRVKCMLAVVTPTSKDWIFKNLLEHLIEERVWFNKNSGKA